MLEKYRFFSLFCQYMANHQIFYYIYFDKNIALVKIYNIAEDTIPKKLHTHELLALKLKQWVKSISLIAKNHTCSTLFVMQFWESYFYAKIWMHSKFVVIRMKNNGTSHSNIEFRTHFKACLYGRYHYLSSDRHETSGISFLWEKTKFRGI